MKDDLQNNKKVRMILAGDMVCSIVMLLFLYTSFSKLSDQQLFKNVLLASPLLRPAAGIIAKVLPILEIAIAILLFIPSMRVAGLYGSALLISIFTIYLGYMIFFIPSLPCSCGGVLRYLSWQQHIIFNLFFILLSFAGIYLYKKSTRHFRTPP